MTQYVLLVSEITVDFFLYWANLSQALAKSCESLISTINQFINDVELLHVCLLSFYRFFSIDEFMTCQIYKWIRCFCISTTHEPELCKMVLQRDILQLNNGSLFGPFTDFVTISRSSSLNILEWLFLTYIINSSTPHFRHRLSIQLHCWS